ncbi:MAG: HTTM domain-containing protein [Chitinophagaceae bacterium]
MSNFARLRQQLFRPTDATSVQLFLRLFGVVVILQAISFTNASYIAQGILAPRFLFQYDFFSFIRPLPEDAMKFVLLLMAASGLMLVLQKGVRAALITFIFSFGYFFLLEKSYYNNHFYLFLLIAFVYLFCHPRRDANGKQYIPYWLLLLLQVQIVIVYFYGGLVKLNPDWLMRQQPMRILLQDSSQNALLPDLSRSDFALYLLTYGGLAFDLLIGFALWSKKYRKPAMITAIAFNLSNLTIFNFGDNGDIGGFPVFMIFTLILFLEPELVAQKWNTLTGNKKAAAPAMPPSFDTEHSLTLTLLTVYMSFQLLFPLRHLLFPGNTNWTTFASRFAWRMKSHSSQGSVRVFVRGKAGEPLQEINIGNLINSMQRFYMTENPVMMWQFAQYLGRELNDRGNAHPEVYIHSMLSLNGRPAQPLVDSTVNMLSLEHNRFAPDKWILPLKD